MNGGVWNGERILSENYVRTAISKQIDTRSESEVNPPATDNFLGYGYQIWQCQPKGVYRADGAMGQFTIVAPDQSMEIAIMENASGAHWAQKTLDVMWEFLDKIPETDRLEENPEKAVHLQKRLRRLSLPVPEFRPEGGESRNLYGRTIHFEKPLQLDIYGILRHAADTVHEKLISEILIELVNPTLLRIKVLEMGTLETEIWAALDGTWKENEVNEGVLNRLLASAYWENDTCLVISMRWIETCGVETLKIHVREKNVMADLTGTLALHDDQLGVVGEYYA